MTTRLTRLMPFFILITVLARPSPQAAKGADAAWFTLVSASGPGAEVVNVMESGPGHALVVQTPGDVSLRISYNFTSGFGQMASWGIQLDAPGSTFTNGESTWYGQGETIGGPAGQSHMNVGLICAPPAYSPGAVFSFDLNVGTLPIGDELDVTGNFQYPYQKFASGALWYGRVGPNRMSFGDPTYGGPSTPPGWGLLPVIVVKNIPEPATLLLLAIIGFPVIRISRRRRTP